MNLNKNYFQILDKIKKEVKTSQIQAFQKVNYELVNLYFDIGKIIYLEQQKLGWGAKVIEKLSEDLKKEFGIRNGYSIRNLKYMISFYCSYKNKTKMQQLVALIPWGQNITILSKCKTEKERKFYLELTIKKGLSRNVLVHQIEGQAYKNSLVKPQTNFNLTIPNNSDLAEKIMKDKYILDFLNVKDDFKELELKKSIIENLKNFLLELGQNFCFIGSEYKIEFEKKEYFIDLLFFNRDLQSLIAIELKRGEFKPEYVGKLNFYLSVLDSKIKKKNENPTIGIILCKSKNKLVVEYALQNSNKAIAVATYKIINKIKKDIKKLL